MISPRHDTLEARYDPDDGPIAEHGEMVSVDSEADILQAIVNAEPGHIITVQPGTYKFSQLITVPTARRSSLSS